MLFDSHAHYDDEKFNTDRFEVLDSLKENGVDKIVNVACSMKSSVEIQCLAEKYPFIYTTVGVHPEDVGGLTEEDMQKLLELSRLPKVVAIGEIGLDYYYDDVPKDIQQKWFARQLDLAKEASLPVVIHDRDAHADCVRILKEHEIEKIGGVMHCYSGSNEMAKEVLKMGMYFGFGGTLTFKNAKKVQASAEVIPIDRILLETDCPYLAPEPYRGTRNSSLLMKYTAEKLAEIKGISIDEVIKITNENAMRFYRIEE